MLRRRRAKWLYMHFAVEQALLPAIIETNSQLVQRQLAMSSNTNSSLLGRLYDDMSSILESYPNLRITHARLYVNKVAHLMAQHARSSTSECFYLSTPPFLTAAIAAEAFLILWPEEL
ncbi:hypothetical protein ABKV19_016712 [Rosa sericea]